MAPAQLNINLQQKKQPRNTKHTNTTINTLKPNKNIHQHIIRTDDKKEDYNMAGESLTQTASDSDKNRFPREVKNTNIIPNKEPNIDTPQK